ncbi:hypothetical protein EO087_15930 [Dyella sp. M7H15-1]|uniref:hypothetical protein n=1 Tax=Dyella sp. M7H15-1 TaxID=2501295 RepID=UPI001004D9B1|nr:hypothetical protein [Dyella sp. M7H15-1]QAU25295.1 hypothetical protein EO087_15930 [Dyella sp. M7H15-1]
MSLHSRDTWIALHTQYYVDPKANHHGLMMDAHILLDSAHGMVQMLGDTISEGDMINNDRMASALHGIALLVEMGRRCVAQAELRMMLANHG